MADLVLPRGEIKVLKAEDKDYDRGLLVRLLKNGGYDMAYWYNKPDKPYPVEVLVDGKSIKKDAKVVVMKFHPKDYYDKVDEDYKNFTFGADWIPTSLAQRKKMKRLHNKTNRSIREAPRVPRKKGQHRGSKSHSDLYTDENPKGTIKGLKFATVADAKASVSKIRSSGKSHAHKIQAAVAMEQRAREMGKTSQAAVYRAYINKMKKKTKAKNEISFVKEHKCGCSDIYNVERMNEKWTAKYKRSIDCSNPKGFSQRAHCQGRKKRESIMDKKLAEQKLGLFLEKNVPTKPAKWAYYKAQAKKKFDVYPSAYANAWAAKQYKAAGGGWRKVKG